MDCFLGREWCHNLSIRALPSKTWKQPLPHALFGTWPRSLLSIDKSCLLQARVSAWKPWSSFCLSLYFPLKNLVWCLEGSAKNKSNNQKVCDTIDSWNLLEVLKSFCLTLISRSCLLIRFSPPTIKMSLHSLSRRSLLKQLRKAFESLVKNSSKAKLPAAQSVGPGQRPAAAASSTQEWLGIQTPAPGPFPRSYVCTSGLRS